MNKMRVAVPSNNPGGLDAIRSEHFGHSDVFTIVNLEDNNIESVEIIGNVPHGAGGCMAPVQWLHNHKVDAIVVSGMGGRPLMHFNQVGIEAYFAQPNSYNSVEEVISGFTNNQLSIMQVSQSCQGGGGSCHSH